MSKLQNKFEEGFERGVREVSVKLAAEYGLDVEDLHASVLAKAVEQMQNKEAFWNAAWNLTKGLGSGAWNMAGNAAKGVGSVLGRGGRGAMSSASHAMSSGKGMWNAAQSGASAFGKGATRAWKSLDPAQQQAMKLVGAGTAGAAGAAGTIGVGSKLFGGGTTGPQTSNTPMR